jgi:hypothetical protein
MKPYEKKSLNKDKPTLFLRVLEIFASVAGKKLEFYWMTFFFL